ncbi:MAG: GAF domain-containing protein [Proteobacteria bacterium]|nr:GAF domain-containing protein [Pseudomonadota bacterium]
MDKPASTESVEKFLRENPDIVKLLEDEKARNMIALLSREDIERMVYILENPWIDIQKAIRVSDSIMNISPEISGDELLNIMCKDIAELTNAQCATCRTYDPIKKVMVASGNYNWGGTRTEEIPYEDSIAGQVSKTKKHYIVPDISAEPLYAEKGKLLSMGINAMLALPILLIDYEGTEKREVLIGTLQIYFKERNKQFSLQQIKLIQSVVGRFSYVLAQKRRFEIQKKANILRESRQALLQILKRTEPLDQVLSFLVAKIAELIQVNRCSLFSIEKDAGGGAFAILIAGYPLEPLAHGYGSTLSFNEHLAFREVFETGEPLLIENARNDPRMRASYEFYLHKKIKNVYFVPIKDEQEVVTHVLVLDGDESKPLEQEDIFFCNSLIQDIELCIQASIRSQERHDSFNQMLSFGALARLYTKKLRTADVTPDELNEMYKKLSKSMLAVEDIITDSVPFAQMERFDLNKVILERLETLYFYPLVSIEKNNLERDLFITADKKKVGRIIGNLLNNAHKKLEELQEGVLKVATYVHDNQAVIEIGNSGAIPPHIRKRIFTDQHILTGKDSSGGLGLSIVKLFTVMHNGTVEFESPPEKNWTVFRIRLPLR